MNLSIAQITALDDCLYLMEHSEDTCEAFKNAIVKARTFALMAGTVGLNEKLNDDLLNHCRSAWNQTLDDESMDRLKEKLALAIGSIGLYGLNEYEGFDAGVEDSLNQDAYIFRVYYMVNESSVPKARTVRDIMTAMKQRNMIELHTFVPYMPAIDQWFEDMNEWDEHVEADVAAFANAATDSSKLDKYVKEHQFYTPDEEILQLLVSLRRGEQITGDALHSALQREGKSGYAKAILSGFKQLRAANLSFMGTAI